jgi:hypothetical protein
MLKLFEPINTTVVSINEGFNAIKTGHAIGGSLIFSWYAGLYLGRCLGNRFFLPGF